MNTNVQNVGYPDALPFPSAASAVVMAENGPKCGKCGKPHRLAKELGGCECPRYTKHRGELASHKSMQLRTLEAAERLNQLIECYMKAQGLDVPSAAVVPAPPAPPDIKPDPTGVAAVDQARAKHAAVKAAS